MANPDDRAVRAAQTDLDRITRTTSAVTLGCLAVAVLGAVIAIFGSAIPFGLMVAAGAATFGALFGVAWLRAVAARASLRDGPVQRVRAAGWCRPPDGCNYAVFIDDQAEMPDVVIRLPLRREMKESVSAWLYGVLRPSVFGGVALVSDDGLVATGRVVTRRAAEKKWQRRGTEPGRWVQRPPEGWKPPGGA